MVDKEIQRYAEEHNEPKFATGIGGRRVGDNDPMDIIVAGPEGEAKHGVELKTVVANTNAKITMKGSAMAKKRTWARKNKARVHTVVLDDTKVSTPRGRAGTTSPSGASSIGGAWAASGWRRCTSPAA